MVEEGRSPISQEEMGLFFMRGYWQKKRMAYSFRLITNKANLGE
jgi:hypothetical protein